MSSNSNCSLRIFAVVCVAVGLGACAGKQDATTSSSDRDKRDAVQPNAAGKSGGGQFSGQAGGLAGKNGGRGPAVAVLTARVREEPFASEVEALGTTKANEAVDIAAKVSNRVTAIRFREGQTVPQGAVLVELDADEARADLAVAEAALVESRNQMNRSRELFQTKALSAQQMDQLEATLRANEARVASLRARLDETTIKAPFGGRVGLRNISVGSLVGPGTVITTLDDTSTMKLDFSVPETFLSALREGLDIEAKSAAYPAQSFRGRVMSIDSRVDPVSRAVLVRAQIPNRDGRLKPGMFMTVRLVRNDSKTLVLPEEALVPERDKQFVFVVRNGKAYRTEIALGRRRPGVIEVLQGLKVGDEVITDGTQKVRDGIAVRIVAAGAEESKVES